MIRRPVLVLAASCCAFLCAAAAAAGVPPPPGSGSTSKPAAARSGARPWAAADIRTVVAKGVMGPDVATFRPQDPPTRADLPALVAGLTHQAPQPPSKPDRTV